MNNLAKTDLTYKDINGKGAEYVITITLQPNNQKAYQPIVITQKFYVKDDFQPYTFNANFYNPATGNVQTKGEVTENGWAMQMNIAQAFTNVNGKDIFGYYADKNANIKFGNVMANPEIAFDFVNTTHAGVDYTKPMVFLTEPLTGNKTWAMKYTVKLVNGESKSNNFGVEFINPFAAGTISKIELNANQIGTVTGDAAKSVNVVEAGTSNAIYSYVGNALALSAKATGTFKLNADQVSVEYAWNTTKGDYKVFTDNLPSKDQLVLSADGTITYEATANLIVTRTLYINATVTFEDLSKVEVEIPVIFKGQN